MADWPTPDKRPPRQWAQRIIALDGDTSAQRELFNQLDEELQKWIRHYLRTAKMHQKLKQSRAIQHRQELLSKLQGTRR